VLNSLSVWSPCQYIAKCLFCSSQSHFNSMISKHLSDMVFGFELLALSASNTMLNIFWGSQYSLRTNMLARVRVTIHFANTILQRRRRQKTHQHHMHQYKLEAKHTSLSSPLPLVPTTARNPALSSDMFPARTELAPSSRWWIWPSPSLRNWSLSYYKMYVHMSRGIDVVVWIWGAESE
jgi:hypothetical protein